MRNDIKIDTNQKRLQNFLKAIFLTLTIFTVLSLNISAVQASVLKPDTSFDSDGLLFFTAPDFYAYGIAVDSSTGKIYVAGDYFDGIDNVVRVYGLNSDGTIDPSFGVAGATDLYGGIGAYVSKIFLRNGKIGLIGSTYSPATESDYTYWQLNLDGSLDTDINGTGVLSPSLSYLEYTKDILFGAGGEIYTLAETSPTPPAFSQNNITIVKYNADGSEESSFGGGYFEYDLGPLNHYHHPVAMFFAPDGKIVVAGYYDDEIVDPHLSMLKVNLDGTYDATFGTNGLVTHYPGKPAYVYAVSETEDASGLILFADGGSGDFSAYKMLWDGTIDTSFGTNGEIALPAGEYTKFFNLPFGGWMLGGSIYYPVPDDSNSLMCQLDYEFAIKDNFAINGCYELEGYYYDYVTAIAAQDDTVFVLSPEDDFDFMINKFQQYYQVDFGGNPANFNAEIAGDSVILNSNEGARGTQTTDILANGQMLAQISKNYSADHDWSSLTGGVDVSGGKSFVHGLTSLPGAAATYTLYVPKTLGSNAVHICPGATSLANVTASCSGGVSYQVGESGVTVENISGQDYWVVPNMTSTGGISIASSSTLPDTGVNIYAFFSIPLAMSILAFAVLKKHSEVV